MDQISAYLYGGPLDGFVYAFDTCGSIGVPFGGVADVRFPQMPAEGRAIGPDELPLEQIPPFKTARYAFAGIACCRSGIRFCFRYEGTR